MGHVLERPDNAGNVEKLIDGIFLRSDHHIGDPFVIAVSANRPCGSRVSLTLQVGSDLGTTEATVELRIGEPTGAGSPVTYTRAIPGGLDIPVTTATLEDRSNCEFAICLFAPCREFLTNPTTSWDRRRSTLRNRLK